MAAPIAVTDYIHLDALVWHAVLEEMLGPAFWHQTGSEHYDLVLPLQLRCQTSSRGWQKKYYAASVAAYPEGFVEGVTAWRKRATDFPAGVGKVDYRRGHFKAFDTPLPYVSAPKICFHAVGALQEVVSLLKNHISHIGKKRSQGYGKIKQITAEPTKEDRSVISDGVLQRPIPVEGCPHKFEDSIEAFYAYRPPYWRLSHLTQCYMPGSRLSLKTKKQPSNNRKQTK